MKPYCLIIIKGQKIEMEFFEEYVLALQHASRLLRGHQYEEIELICYRTHDNVICYTFQQRKEDEE